MGIEYGHLERGSLPQRRLQGGVQILPPNLATLFVAAVVVPSAGPFPIAMTVVRRSWGGASTVHLNVGTLGDWTAGDSITVRLTGLDHNLQAVSEDLTLAFVADADDTKRSQHMYRRLDTATVIAATGTFTTATFSIGISNGTNADLEPNYVWMPMPSRRCKSHLDFVFQPVATAALSPQLDTTSNMTTTGRIQATVANGEAFAISPGSAIVLPIVAGLTFLYAGSPGAFDNL